MELNKESFDAINQGLNASFNKSLETTEVNYESIAMVVNSKNASEVYPALKSTPGLRKFIGERQVHSLGKGKFSIENEPYEHTIGIPRTAIEDDSIGIYNKQAADQGRKAKIHPDALVFKLLKAGVSTLCFDGQNFFDTDHPVLDENGEETSYSNYYTGAGELWVLADDSQEMKAIILQERTPVQFTSKTDEKDDNVFFKNEYLYGVYWRGAVGYGLPQLVVGSKETLNAQNFEKAQANLEGRKGDHGEPLALNATTLYVTPNNYAAAKSIVKAQTLANGASNPNYEAVKIVKVPYLA